MYGGEEIPGGLVVTCGDSAELLELAVEVFDEMAGLVDLVVEGARSFAVALWRNDDRLACCQQRLDDALVGIEGFIGQQSIRMDVRAAVVGVLLNVGLG